jgi:HEAT repeat protein
MFLGCVQDTDEFVTSEATMWLGLKINPAKMAVPVLIAALDSKHSRVRENAARSLGNYGMEASAAVTKLEAHREDSDSFVCLQVAEALRKIAPSAITNSSDQTIKPYGPVRSSIQPYRPARRR